MELVHLSDTGRVSWRHDPIGTGEIDFVAIFKTLGDIAFNGLSVMEIVSLAPDRDLQDSWDKLVACGWEGKSQ